MPKSGIDADLQPDPNLQPNPVPAIKKRLPRHIIRTISLKKRGAVCGDYTQDSLLQDFSQVFSFRDFLFQGSLFFRRAC